MYSFTNTRGHGKTNFTMASLVQLFNEWEIQMLVLLSFMLHKASFNGEFHRPGFQDVKLWYEIDVSLSA
jgi:hypothetical protein